MVPQYNLMAYARKLVYIIKIRPPPHSGQWLSPGMVSLNNEFDLSNPGTTKVQISASIRHFAGTECSNANQPVI